MTNFWFDFHAPLCFLFRLTWTKPKFPRTVLCGRWWRRCVSRSWAVSRTHGGSGVLLACFCSAEPLFAVAPHLRWQQVRVGHGAVSAQGLFAAEVPVWWAEGASGPLRTPDSDGGDGAPEQYVPETCCISTQEDERICSDIWIHTLKVRWLSSSKAGDSDSVSLSLQTCCVCSLKRCTTRTSSARTPSTSGSRAKTPPSWEAKWWPWDQSWPSSLGSLTWEIPSLPSSLMRWL